MSDFQWNHCLFETFLCQNDRSSFRIESDIGFGSRRDVSEVDSTAHEHILFDVGEDIWEYSDQKSNVGHGTCGNEMNLGWVVLDFVVHEENRIFFNRFHWNVSWKSFSVACSKSIFTVDFLRLIKDTLVKELILQNRTLDTSNNRDALDTCCMENSASIFSGILNSCISFTGGDTDQFEVWMISGKEDGKSVIQAWVAVKPYSLLSSGSFHFLLCVFF
mmetsp:Transcript_26001/g.30134  ORF Transcript_26001/g.30134 Transcript_26001/m.30134 type:complete len:218 (+) Transcript_26001:611-1264(+)